VPGRSWVLLAAAALVAAAATTAHAATLPLTAKKLYASARAADTLPNRLAYDQFTTATDVTLDNRLADTGQRWDVVRGTMRVSSGKARCTSCAGDWTAALIDADLVQVSASVQIRVTGSSGPVGLVLNAAENASSAYAVWYDNGGVQLLRYVNGNVWFPVQQAVSPVPLNTDVPLTARYGNGTYTVSLNGATVFTYTLSASDQAAIANNTYFGVVVFNENAASRLDEFEVTR
jgi:hypothetical protein